MTVQMLNSQNEEIMVTFDRDMLEMEDEYRCISYIPCATIHKVEQNGVEIQIDNFERRYLIDEILES